MTVRCEIGVKGIVQGVGFRYYVLQRARLLNVTGFVRNRENDSVEIIIEGDRSLIEEMLKFVKTGPSGSRVEEMNVVWKKFTGSFQTFEIR